MKLVEHPVSTRDSNASTHLMSLRLGTVAMAILMSSCVASSRKETDQTTVGATHQRQNEVSGEDIRAAMEKIRRESPSYPLPEINHDIQSKMDII